VLWPQSLDAFSNYSEDEPMMIRAEGCFSASDGAELFYQTWTTSEAHGSLVVTHGLSEHSESYDRFFAPAMTAHGWNVIAWDLRGHGRSAGKRGHVDHFDVFRDDLITFIDFLQKSGKLTLPYALVGHSMGGLISLLYMLQTLGGRAFALALSSPLLGVSVAVPPAKDLAARGLARLVPSLTMGNEINHADLTRDAEMLKTYDRDPLRHEKISPALYLSMMEAMKWARAQGFQIQIPLLMQVAGRERITSRPESELFFESVRSEVKRLIVYEESLHEIYNDLDRRQVFADLNSFLNDVLEKHPKGVRK